MKIKLLAFIAALFCVQPILAADSGTNDNDKAAATASDTASAKFGSYLRPFAANSLWNSRPVNPVFGKDTIPADSYEAVINAGSFSTSFFLADEKDGPVTIYGVFDQDAEVTKDLVLPRWPAKVTPAAASDGHIDVLDPVTGIIHSFWVARVDASGKWTAKLYAWEKIDGTGWGEAAHYYKGARATAVPTSAGIIRKHEINDGRDLYSHALAMSLTYSALSPVKPGYVFPATSADFDYSANKGKIPEGALLMLPPDFDLSKISNPAIRKVAKTLMVYGAYVVDRNTGTPFAIYEEIGLPQIAGWKESGDTRQIRAALRQVTASEFVDGNGRKFTPNRKMNIISLRGKYQQQSGKEKSYFDSWTQRRVWDKTSGGNTEFTYSNNIPAWAQPVAGDDYLFTADGAGGAKIKLQVMVNENGKQVSKFDSGDMASGSKSFTWPQGGYIVKVLNTGAAENSSVGATLIKK